MREQSGSKSQALSGVPGDVRTALLDMVDGGDYAEIEVAGETHTLLRQAGVWWYKSTAD